MQDKQKESNPSSSTVNMVEDGKKTKGYTNPKKRNNYDSKVVKGKKSKNDDETPQNGCWTCGKPGHFKKDCTIWKRRMNKKKGNGDSSQSQEKQGNACVLFSLNSPMN